MSLTCEQALAQAVEVDLGACSVEKLQAGGQVLATDDGQTFFDDTLCPMATDNMMMDWNTTQLAVAYRAVQGCFDTMQVTKAPLTCDEDGNVLVQLDIVDTHTDCSQICRGVNFYHYAVQLPADATAVVNATYVQNCGPTNQNPNLEDTSTATNGLLWGSYNGFLLGMTVVAMVWKNLVH